MIRNYLRMFFVFLIYFHIENCFEICFVDYFDIYFYFDIDFDDFNFFWTCIICFYWIDILIFFNFDILNRSFLTLYFFINIRFFYNGVVFEIFFFSFLFDGEFVKFAFFSFLNFWINFWKVFAFCYNFL